MKNGGGGKGIFKIIMLIILIVGIFALFVGALIRQYAVYGGSFPAPSSDLKYLFIGLIIILPLSLIHI